MSNSDILNNFIKIAEEKGLISEKSSGKTKQILEKTHRADSLSIADIEKLYGIKPDMAKDNKYTRNIIEDAHPESYVASNAHDKLNGLVENINQRQDIILHILDKTPNGHLTQHKYAEKDLILSLVRVGNDLDNHNKEKLRILADTCLLQVSNPLKKEGGWSLISIPILLGALYLQQHMAFANEGFERNHQKLSAEIDDLLNSSSSWGVGYDYKSDFKSMLEDFKNKIDNFYSLYVKATPIITDLEKPRTAKELMELAKKPQTNTVVKTYGVLKTAIDNMLPYIVSIEKNFSSEAYKARQIEDKGFMSSIVDRVQILHGGKGMIADDFDDVVRAIAPYKQSVKEAVDLFKNAESIEQSAQQKIQEVSSGIQEEKPVTSIDAGKVAPQGKTKKPRDLDDEMRQLEKDLTGGLF